MGLKQGGGVSEYFDLSKPEGKRPFVKIRNRWEDNIKTEFEVFADWIHLAEDSKE
jgi:hypothetical protein